jgi:hypothetical protein
MAREDINKLPRDEIITHLRLLGVNVDFVLAIQNPSTQQLRDLLDGFLRLGLNLPAFAINYLIGALKRMESGQFWHLIDCRSLFSSTINLTRYLSSD